MFKINQFREYIVQEPLKKIGLYSPEAEELLIATAAQESLGGTFLNGVSGLGIYGMSEERYQRNWDFHLVEKRTNMSDLEQNKTKTVEETLNTLGFQILKTSKYSIIPSADVLTANLVYATLNARVFYEFFVKNLPPKFDIINMWGCYEGIWGRTIELDEFTENYTKFVCNE